VAQNDEPSAVHGLRGRGVTLRPATHEDVSVLAAILNEPEVTKWWGPADPSDLEADLALADVEHFVIEVGGETAGMVQFSEETDPMYHAAGIDIALSARFQGLGHGTDAVRTLARYLLEERGHHRLTIDPAAANARAIAAYTRVGFRPVGVMRQYERGVDGEFHDGLLMEMLVDELVP
jgi:aminoglycoside 6'-N-acetyltransferase